MEVKKFTYEIIDSKMYLIIENNNALVIDPCISHKCEKYLHDSNVKEIIIIPTHEHYDHVSGINWFKKNFMKTIVICSEKCHENMQSPIKNGSKLFYVLFFDKDTALREEARNVKPFSCKGDRRFKKELLLYWQGHKVYLKETPGHSQGSISILIDEKYLFSGDSLIKNRPVITKLPGGNREEYENITKPFYKGLKDDVYVFPGHGSSGYIHDFNF